MNKTATTISQGSLQYLYLQKGPPSNNLLLQILAFQPSEFNPKEIILRISDKQSFLDCILVGPYTISNSKIMSVEYSHSSQSFKALDVIRVTDYFCKIDPSKMCNLKMIIRKIEECSSFGEILGRPEEISQFIENSLLKPKSYAYNSKYLVNAGTVDIPIKIQENAELIVYQAPVQKNGAQISATNQNYQQNSQTNYQQKQQQTLTLQDIMSNKTGFFIGRLVRYKFGAKEAKDGPMSFLYLGFLDINGDIVRVNLAGRIAIKQSRELKKGKVYFIKGLELYYGDKLKGAPQIRLKEKQYKIQQIQNQVIKSQYKHNYYKWEHENQWTQSQMVDVIGIVEDIEEKASYKNSNTYQQQRDVVRLIIRNAFKTVRINFWADHINILNNLNLNKKQKILIEDIKKKKSIFLDYIAESNIIILDEESQLKDQFIMFLPPEQEAPQPNNVKQLLQVYELQPFNTKIRILNLTLSSINPKLIYYKMCNICKKKVQKILQTCLECHQSNFTHRYNCYMDLSDSSGSVNCIGFDGVCQKLFGRTANQFCLLKDLQIKEIIDVTLYDQYRVSIENKNNRKIIRVLEKLLTNDIITTSNNNINYIRQNNGHRDHQGNQEHQQNNDGYNYQNRQKYEKLEILQAQIDK